MNFSATRRSIPTCSLALNALTRLSILSVRAGRAIRAQACAQAKDRQILHNVLIPLVANLMHHYLIGSPGQGIPVPRSNKALGGKGNRYQPFSFPRSFPKMLDALCALGFAEVTIGEYSGIPGKSKRTTVKAGPKLIELIKQHRVILKDLSDSDEEEVIILKRFKRGYWDGGARIDYRDTPTTKRFRSELRAINAWLAKADIRFNAAPLSMIDQ